MMISVTDKAKKQMCAILERNNEVVVRYELSGGGCGGLIGKWKTEPHYEPDMNEWIWYLTDEYKFVLDEATATYMDNAKIDFGGEFMPMFTIEIPSKQACGCGESWVVE